jgi:hypothetical protein
MQKAGTLWSALADFDDTVRKLAHRSGTPSFERRHLKEKPGVFDFPFSSCPELSMAAAMEDGLLLACMAPNAGAIEVAQITAHGKKMIQQWNRGGQMFHRWRPPKESCHVRFTFNGGNYREVLTPLMG